MKYVLKSIPEYATYIEWTHEYATYLCLGTE